LLNVQSASLDNDVGNKSTSRGRLDNTSFNQTVNFDFNVNKVRHSREVLEKDVQKMQARLNLLKIEEHKALRRI